MKPQLSSKTRPSPTCGQPGWQLSLGWLWGILGAPVPSLTPETSSSAPFLVGKTPFDIGGLRQGKSQSYILTGSLRRVYKLILQAQYLLSNNRRACCLSIQLLWMITDYSGAPPAQSSRGTQFTTAAFSSYFALFRADALLFCFILMPQPRVSFSFSPEQKFRVFHGKVSLDGNWGYSSFWELIPKAMS